MEVLILVGLVVFAALVVGVLTRWWSPRGAVVQPESSSHSAAPISRPGRVRGQVTRSAPTKAA